MPLSEDVDECALGKNDCDPLVQCVNFPGGYNCTSCPPGYLDVYGDGTFCQGIVSYLCFLSNYWSIEFCIDEINISITSDIDECNGDGERNCTQQGLNCTNLPGSFVCTSCLPGHINTSQGCTCTFEEYFSFIENCTVTGSFCLNIITTIITAQYCGNGIVDVGEECDNGFRCLPNCTCAPGYTSTSPPSSNCTSRMLFGHFFVEKKRTW